MRSGYSAAEPENTQGFRKAVTLAGIREHQAAFQSFADRTGGIRASGTEGYELSAQYVVDRLVAAGYNPTYQEFPFPFFIELSAAVMQQISPNAQTYRPTVDFRTMTYSGAGDVTAPVSRPSGAMLGCAPGDFAGFPAGSIALVERGVCAFRQKALNAQNAGASGVIIYNNIPNTVLQGTLSEPGVTIPTVGTSREIGESLLAQIPNSLTMRLRTDTISEQRITKNIIAETPGGDPNNVVVVGAHLDSVTAGPGINDNGSGSATILEVAEVFAQQGREPRNKLRFMWFGAEELGLLGSNYYVNQLNQQQRDSIAVMLNFDMIGSPNGALFVYDGDNSTFAPPNALDGPDGSGAIEQVFVEYFTSQGLPSAATPLSGRSDYGPFMRVGIPAGGLFTGAEGIKTAQQAAIFGGTAGVAFDPCYHQACDTYANNNDTILDRMSDAVAHTVLVFSKWNFATQPLVDPTSTVGNEVGSGGGGLHDDDHALPDR